MPQYPLKDINDIIPNDVTHRHLTIYLNTENIKQNVNITIDSATY